MNLGAPRRKMTPPTLAPRRRRGGCLLRAFVLLALLAGGTVLLLQVAGDEIVPPVVDAVRNVIGAEAMAEVEAQYYGFAETLRQWQSDLGWGPTVQAPWAVHTPVAPGAQAMAGPLAPTPMPPAPGSSTKGSAAPLVRPTVGGIATPPDTLPDSPETPSPLAGNETGDGVASTPSPAPDLPTAGPATGPPALAPIIADGALAGEGLWTATDLPLPPDGGAPIFWKTYLRPTAARPAALAYLVRFDPQRVTLHMTAGTTEPSGAGGVPGPGQVAAADWPWLAAAFNGGWKAINGHYGMVVAGHQIAPPNPLSDTATLAIHADGRVEIGPWQTLRTAPDLVSYRQNCPLLIDQGTITVQDHMTSTWGLSPLNRMYVWRSGLGLTADGALIYAAGTPLTATELAVALQRAGAVYAMQLDINSAWVHWLNYTRTSAGHLQATPLVPGMAARPNQYLSPGTRDFFYLTWPNPHGPRPAPPVP